MSDELRPLLAKYDVPGPRYTSYPTVPAWGEDVTSQDYRASLGSLTTGDTLSLYFHLPFCEKLCHFCGCMKVITSDRSRSAEYVQVLLAELDRVAELLPSDVRDVSQVHFGGGTPNFLRPKELKNIMRAIHKHFNLLPDAEVAIEMHPRTSTAKFCDALKELEFTRISLGVQDFDPVVQKLINRFQSYEVTEEMLSYLRQLGFTAFNFDLVYGLPGQSMSGWTKTLEQIKVLQPDRLAVYSYAHVPWVAPIQRSFEDSDLPSPEMKLDLFEKAYQTLTGEGYRLIGLDHFAREDDELAQASVNGTIHRNFMGYSTRADAHQIGLGVSAISYVGGNYFQNSKALSAYYGSIRDGELATFRGMLLNQEDALRRAIVTQIMCNGRIDYGDFEREWGIKFADSFAPELGALEPFAADGLIEIDDAGFRVSGLGYLFLRNMAMVFDTYLDEIKAGAKTPTFSRTV